MLHVSGVSLFQFCMFDLKISSSSHVIMMFHVKAMLSLWPISPC